MVQSLPITNFQDLSKLYTGRKQVRRLGQSELRPIHALDVETFNGDVFLLADDEGRLLDKDITADSILDYLFSSKYAGTWNFCYNLSYDAESILKLLGSRLFIYTKTGRLRFKYGKYRINYIPSKSLQIMKGHHSVVVYDIAQFYNRVPLPKAYQENIGELDEEYLKFKSKRSEFSPRFYRDYTSQVRNYCIKDCQMTKALSEKWIGLFYKAFGFYAARWFSSGYLAEKVLINNGVFFPSFDSIPYEIQHLAFKSYFGGRFELIKRGFIGQAYLYDINSAYPYAIAQLPDLSDGKWVNRKSIHPDAALGFFEIEADIPDVKPIAPFPFKRKCNLCFPSGKFKTYVTLAELQACENPDYYKILDSWQFVSNSDRRPYKEFIAAMYNKRLVLKRNYDPLQLPLKVILNSIYGKTGQKVNKVIGNLFNPVIFAFITGYTRAQLYKFVIENGLEKEVVAFATDSICTTRELSLKSEKLGNFNFEKEGEDVFYLQNGIYRFGGKWKNRGFGKMKGKDIEHVDTIVRDGKPYLKLQYVRPARLKSSILQNRIQEIGKFKTITKLVNPDADNKRFWLGRIESIDGRVSNDSIPISLNYLDQ